MRAMTFIMTAILLSAPLFSAQAGPFKSDGISGDSPAFIGWATGYLDYLPAQVGSGWATPEKALGPATGQNFDIVSLGENPEGVEGEPGRITLTFDAVIQNGGGPDFAIFENAFLLAEELFAELAFVEVSTDGETFARFPTISLTGAPVDDYGTLDPTDVYNLPGIHPNAYGVSYGTPFDLAELTDCESVLAGDVDLSNIHYIRLVDIPGTGDFSDQAKQLGYDDNHPIYDPFPAFDSGGFDLEAVGVLNGIPPVSDDDDDATDDDDDDDDDSAPWLEDDDDDNRDDDTTDNAGDNDDSSGSSCSL